jgi:hypothetical protein
VDNKGCEIDRGKTHPGNSNDSAGGKPSAAPEREDASGHEAEERTRRVCQPVGHRGEAGLDPRESLEPGSEPSAAEKYDLICHKMAQEDGPENRGGCAA